MAKPVADKKKYLREILGESRAALPLTRGEALSSKIQARLLECSLYGSASTLVLYCAQENEVRTDRILADAVCSGRRVFFPRVDRKRRLLELVRVSEPAELTRGEFGIPEPTGAEIISCAEFDRALICVPGLAFGPSGQRLGRGGGYYDRLIAQAGPATVTAGLAYSFQLLDALPESAGDQRVQFVITESTVYTGGNAPRSRAGRSEQGGIPRCTC
jgi:5-formyltetrahydrofolate cyclo-ligase